MRHRAVGTGLLILGFILVPAFEVRAQKKKGAEQPATAAIDSAKLSGKVYEGYLKSVPGSDRMFTLEIPQPGPPNKKMVSAYQDLERAQLRLLQARTPQAAQKAQLGVAQARIRFQNAQVTVQKDWKSKNTPKQEIEFQASEKVKVRTMLLPDQFDDKGNIKKYSTKELDELRGKDRNLPGFESSLDKLESGQKVQVTLAAAPGGGNPSGEDKDKDAEAKPDKKVQVRLIVVKEPALAGYGDAPKRGKKK